jgi:hypothetical protein
VIDRLNAERIAKDYGVAHIYFEYQEQKQQTSLVVMASIVRQLLAQIPPSRFIEDVRKMYQEKRSQQPMLDDIKQILSSIPGQFSRVFVVCDALDEMDQYNQREHLLPLFHHMKDSGIRLFLTTRPHPADIQESFSTASIIELTPAINDLRLYVEERLFKNTRFQRIIQNEAGGLRERTITTIVDASAGV